MAIYSWNIQHVPQAWNMLANNSPNGFRNADAICIQESNTIAFVGLDYLGTYSDTLVFRGVRRIGTLSRGLDMSVAVAWFGQTGQNSVGIMIRGNSISPQLDDMDVIVPPFRGTRAAIGLKMHDGIWAYSIHAPSNGGSPWQRRWINEVLNKIRTNRGQEPWICAGDYNANPMLVRESINTNNERIVTPNQPTQQSGGELDFAVCTRGVQIDSAKVISNFGSDHWPVRFTGPYSQ